MKKLAAALMAIALVTGAFVTGAVQPPATVSEAAAVEESEYRLQVNGEGSVTVTPDMAYINIGVETQDKDASKAQEENAKLMTQVKKAIMDAGVKEKDMQTMNYSIYKTYNYLKDSEREEVYRASNTLKVTVYDLDNLGDLIDVASKSGANQISSIQFTVQDEEAYYQEALVLAMENAKGKANAILGTMNKKAGMPVRISESSYGGGILRDTGAIAFSAKAEDMNYSTPIQAGDIEVTANVSVEYDYSK
eukprot:gnl/Carplike_NY0171/3606_a4873_347.p1 GENE.gnl/Carplike_NY0171/3606_a4873_347~~gnl/Carplike_NY0171/3606_a4873_347.p1  ORF type:complete len:249 (-),score=26.69 gnl/Carplike_NY0171/3606_a4873_347:120-866(-)